jgi:hypothetical protein
MNTYQMIVFLASTESIDGTNHGEKAAGAAQIL